MNCLEKIVFISAAPVSEPGSSLSHGRSSSYLAMGAVRMSDSSSVEHNARPPSWMSSWRLDISRSLTGIGGGVLTIDSDCSREGARSEEASGVSATS